MTALPGQTVWTVYVCSVCGYRTFSTPNGLPCVRCLSHDGQHTVKVVPAVERDHFAEALREIGELSPAHSSAKNIRAAREIVRAALGEGNR